MNGRHPFVRLRRTVTEPGLQASWCLLLQRKLNVLLSYSLNRGRRALGVRVCAKGLVEIRVAIGSVAGRTDQDAWTANGPWRTHALSRAGRAQLRASSATRRIGLFGAPSMSTPNQPHIPVMLEEVLRELRPLDGSTIVAATYGAGGYSRAMLGGGATVFGIDRDPDAVAAAQPMLDEFDGKLTLHHGRFSQLDMLSRSAGYESVDGVVADIGVSSMQIDQAERGFSFLRDGPLDMRMEQSGPSAADVVNLLPRNDLTRVIGILGEERQASRVSAQIVQDREKRPFETTLQLASVVEKVLGRKAKDKIHPATRTFQALRIAVNGELDVLTDFLSKAPDWLNPGGRLAIISFHSLEDRIVKYAYRGDERLQIITKKPLVATREE